jgi:hypothetical protein
MNSGHFDLDHALASRAPKTIVLRIRGNGLHKNFRFVPDPATGALKIPVDLRAEISGALMAEVRRFQLRLYLQLAKLYFLKFRLQLQSALENVVRDLKGNKL